MSERAFLVWFEGEAHEFRTRSRSAARYASYRAFRDAGYRADFLWFCQHTRVVPSPVLVSPDTTETGDAAP